MHVYDLDSSWESWTTVDGIRSDRVSALEIDTYGRKWIGTGQSDGTGSNGLSVLDDNDTPFDKSDDDLDSYLELPTDDEEYRRIAARTADLLREIVNEMDDSAESDSR